MSACAERALIVAFPPSPLITGAGHFGLLVASGGLNFDRASLYSRPTGAYQSKIYRRAALTHTAWCVPTCLVRRWSGGPAATVLPRQAVSVQRRHFLISAPVGPRGPGQGGCKVLCSEPPDEISYFTGGRPLVKRGSGGNDCERPLREGAHRKQPPAILWFLSDRSERNIASPRPVGRNPLKTQKKETHNAERR